MQCDAHSHFHTEIVCMTEGTTIAFADGKKYELSAGDIFIAFPNQIHKFVSVGKEKFRLMIIDPDMTPDFTALLTADTPVCSKIENALGRVPDLAAISDLISRCGEQGGSFEDSVLRGLLTAFFGRLLPQLQFTSPVLRDGANSAALREILKYTNLHFAEELSLDVLQKEVHLSKYYVSHLFSEKLGIKFNDYVNSMRISHACRLLLREDASITEIATAVGFNTLRTFNRAFVRFRGVTPSEYRNGKQKAPAAPSMYPL